ncbi:Protein of unknown function CGGC region [Desulfofarcimen acetoxidans DSM 771]|uniref:CGGC domain-containing protein n=1 Tax=Desulfofarcimen acetoxidans (strain ATCC 49208 / DSM 771 / KCTC 5769 / VKM B-1644 / 5575) TaxID=485916 RepID=C8W4Q2_DESAS|nr:CGGC domain-containing protein [Desulfofarcimen acetoxidans]ACV63938.1 Protein of unknown function CGGC region [Desulfofarcimen acetoxidans DSM 771]
MSRIGIINCSNIAGELDCAAVVCLGDMRKRKGFFNSYSKEESLELIGIISCAGCPTAIFPEKILRKVDAIASFRVDAIHFSYCMVNLCPFINKYVDVISAVYPDIKLVMGTHTPHDKDKFHSSVKKCLTRVGKNATDIIKGNV